MGQSKETKVCSKCKQEKNVLEFSESIDKRTGRSQRHSYCHKCRREYSRKYNKQHRQNHLWREYGITDAQIELMLKLQDGKCAICGQPETVKRDGEIQPLSVDHDHKTYKIRGLLCNNCNLKLGVLEDPDWTPEAVEYLEEYQCLGLLRSAIKKALERTQVQNS